MFISLQPNVHGINPLSTRKIAGTVFLFRILAAPFRFRNHSSSNRTKTHLCQSIYRYYILIVSIFCARDVMRVATLTVARCLFLRAHVLCGRICFSRENICSKRLYTATRGVFFEADTREESVLAFQSRRMCTWYIIRSRSISMCAQSITF